MSSVKLKHIETFVQVAEQGSFSLVARQKGVSVVAISKQVSCLETCLTMQLFKRKTRSLELTEAGFAYYEKCKKILRELSEANLLIKSLHTEPEGTLSITCGRFFLNSLFYLIFQNSKKIILKSR